MCSHLRACLNFASRPELLLFFLTVPISGTIEFLIKLLKEAQESEDRRAQGLSCSELANGLGRLAVNDANKSKVLFFL